MSIVEIAPGSLTGHFTAPPSKSFSHRAIICKELSAGQCNVSPLVFSQDIGATSSAIKQITAQTKKHNNLNIVDCHESGSTLRFLIPIAGALNVNTIFRRSDSLAKRPITQFLKILSKAGMTYIEKSDLSIAISGQLHAGNFYVPGNISSQFVSGLLMALPLLKYDSNIILTSNLESSKYVDVTIDVLKNFGIKITKTKNGFFINGNQKYRSVDYAIEGDWSQAAFFMVGAAVSGEITFNNLNINSSQPDVQIVDILKRFGAKISFDDNVINVKKSNLTGITVDVSEIPDLVPAIAVAAAYAHGTTNIVNAHRLKLKECDRLSAIYTQLKNIGVNIKKSSRSLTIYGDYRYNGGTVWGNNDHRIVMALSIMGVNLPEKLRITDANSINKSYPDFFKDFNSVNGNSRII